MPAGANNGFDAERFAKLMAGFDTGNACEAEAMNKGRAMRRMLVAAGLRFVDVMERGDVKQALDAQLQPVRENSAELVEARKKAEEWRKEVTERIQQVRQLAEVLKTREQEFDAYRRKAEREMQARGARVGAAGAGAGPVNGGLTAVVVVLVVALLIAAALR